MKKIRQFDSDFIQNLMNKANLGWWQADMTTETYVCSDFICKLLGLGEDGVISFANYNRLILKEDQNHSYVPSSEKLQHSVEDIYLLNTPSGAVWMRSKACYQETDEEGHIKVYGISETHQGNYMSSAYEALRNSERILHNIYKNLPVGIELYNKDGYLIDINKKELELFQVSGKEEVLGNNIFDNPVLPEDIKTKIRAHEDADFTFKYDFSKVGEYYNSQHKSGFINLMTRITTLYDNRNQPINYLLINMDKTEDLIAYNKIQEFESFFELVGDYAKVGYAHFDGISRDGYALSSWYRNVGEEEGTPLPQIIGIHSHFHPEDQAIMIDFLDKVVKGESTKLCRDVRILRKDGNYTWTRVNVLVRDYNPENNYIEMLCINFDITEIKNTEKMLIAAKEKAEESDRLKSAFVANMSHEIRTPLNAIVGFSSMLQETENSDEKRQYIEIIEENNRLLLQLISDILDLSKIEAGSFDIHPEEVSIQQLCVEILQTMSIRNNPHVKFCVAPNLDDLLITSDRRRLHQVLTNFITNAFKFTSEGTITLSYQVENNEVKFMVKDTGMGIAPDKQKDIFTRFVKLNNFIPGTGLGLPICLNIVNQLGGRIGVESELGKGSCFWFTHPLN